VCGLLIDGTRAPACRLAALGVVPAGRQLHATSRKLVQESACIMHSTIDRHAVERFMWIAGNCMNSE